VAKQDRQDSTFDHSTYKRGAQKFNHRNHEISQRRLIATEFIAAHTETSSW
jgi:hypothetical protein